jgi:hypothetical protein
MTTKITNRFDAIDIDELRHVISHEAFKTIQVRIEVELKRATETCTRSESQTEVLRAQGAVAALKAVLEIPGRLLNEMSHLARPKP